LICECAHRRQTLHDISTQFPNGKQTFRDLPLGTYDCSVCFGGDRVVKPAQRHAGIADFAAAERRCTPRRQKRTHRSNWVPSSWCRLLTGSCLGCLLASWMATAGSASVCPPASESHGNKHVGWARVLFLGTRSGLSELLSGYRPSWETLAGAQAGAQRPEPCRLPQTPSFG